MISFKYSLKSNCYFFFYLQEMWETSVTKLRRLDMVTSEEDAELVVS